jgi:hypothetical protein
MDKNSSIVDTPAEFHVSKQNNSIVLVSAIFSSWNGDVSTSSFRFLADIGSPLIMFYVEEFITTETRETLQNEYSNVTFVPMSKVEFPWDSIDQFSHIQLPNCRNAEKDTATHIWQMHSKVACLKVASDICDYSPYSFVWADLNVRSLCDKSVQSFLSQLSRQAYINMPLTDQMIFPGCWAKLQKSEVEPGEKLSKFLNHVYWRFCGSVCWGNASAIRKFWNLYRKYFAGFLILHQVLTWEVNFWAWLEVMAEEEWSPIWYAGDHNNNLFRIPPKYYAVRLGAEFLDIPGHVTLENAKIHTHIVNYDYPEISNYYPMNASYLQLKDGTRILNTRFVNYKLMETGWYWWPDTEGRTIRNKNICSVLDFGRASSDIVQDTTLKPVKHTSMLEVFKDLTYVSGKLSEGVEDIRLFQVNDEIRFIGSQYSYYHESEIDKDRKIRMITGKYDYLRGIMTDGKIVETDAWCEKNWIPVVKQLGETETKLRSEGKQEEAVYIYKWCPMQIGVLEDVSPGLCRFVTKTTHTTPSLIFEKVRGSSGFFPGEADGTRGLLGIVHFSEDSHPTRKYYHRLVLLDELDLRPLKYTDCFYFCELGIEFCIGMTQLDKKYVFWISSMDRDARMLECDIDFVAKWNVCEL